VARSSSSRWSPPGAGSVIYWLVRDDLRFYFLIQALAVLAIPLVVGLFPPRYTGGRELLLAVALYGLAKVFELLDEPIYRLGHLVSGHTLKHIFAGLAGWVYLRMLYRRRLIPSPPEAVLRGACDRLGTRTRSMAFRLMGGPASRPAG
jgi:hypothetical protein